MDKVIMKNIDADTGIFDDRTPTDPAKALREACQMLKAMLANQEAERLAHEARMEELGKTIDLSASQVAELKAEWEAEHGKKRIDGWKFLRSIAAKVVGDIDLLSK